MHNKTYTIDGLAAIVGGRNIGDEYFYHKEHLNFRDLDLFTVGPVVAEVSRSFQDYWDSPWSIPIDLIVSAEPDQAKRESLVELVGKNRVEPFDNVVWITKNNGTEEYAIKARSPFFKLLQQKNILLSSMAWYKEDNHST